MKRKQAIYLKKNSESNDSKDILNLRERMEAQVEKIQKCITRT